ncbi:MAG: ATP-dependent helicase, partial [Anaerolineae bacterium]
LRILRQAQRLGLPVDCGAGEESLDGLDHRVLGRARVVARTARLPFADELGSLDDDDFLSYVGTAKGNLKYADLGAAQLPEPGQRIAGQAEPPEGREWYLDLFRLYEEVRRQNRLVTYDDMLTGAWEALLRHPELLQRVQGHCHYLLVDEFQDVNLAQVELLRLVAGPRDNYMAIGDDDQTIYEWRGASPSFIRDFARGHRGTTEYYMDDCFRCPAAPLALANAVIERDKQRRPKRMHLTQGFGGGAQVHLYATAAEQAAGIAAQIERERAAGRPLADIAILVRLTAQTPPLEQALLERRIPYLIKGDRPFFARDEVRVLLDYCLLAEEETHATGEAGATGEASTAKAAPDAEERRRAWLSIYNRPKRYVSRAAADETWALVERRGLTLAAAIERVAQRPVHERMSGALLDLRRLLQWLAKALPASTAHQLLTALEARLHYVADLRESATSELGQQKAANVESFIEYARGHGDLAGLRRHLAELAATWARREREAHEPVLTISTVHRAKGLEWPVVFVPDCNEGFIPCATADNIAEERRLLYVAITRAREHLHLSRLGRNRQSRFLEQAQPDDVLRRLERVTRALSLPVERWGVAEGLEALCADAAILGLHSYFLHFWPADADTKARAVRRIHSLHEAVKGGKRQARSASLGQVLPWREISPEGWAASIEAIALPEASPEPGDGRGPRPESKGRTATPPAAVAVGHWAHTDAGWGRITHIWAAGGAEVDICPADGPRPAVLEVVLRPGHDALPARVDLAAGQITFTRTRLLYTCSLCNHFASSDPHLISGKHNRAAHGGRGASFRKEPSTRLALTGCYYRRQPPEEELAEEG